MGVAANFTVGEAKYGLAEKKEMAGKRTEEKTEKEVIQALLREASRKLGAKEITVAEFIKLMQLRKELESDELKEVEVRWVEPQARDDAGKP